MSQYTVVVRSGGESVVVSGQRTVVRARLSKLLDRRTFLPWTPERDQYIRENYRRERSFLIAARFARESGRNFTKNSVISRARKLGLSGGKGGAA